MGKEDELVLVIPREVIPFSPMSGVRTDSIQDIEKLAKECGIFKERGDVEEDENFKQIIPYMVFKFKDRYFLMQRTNKGYETRAHNLFSLGIGGHINKEDLEGETMADWAKREFEEEVEYNGSFTERTIGIIHDDSIPVNSVHLGYIMLLEGDSDQIKIKDEHLSGKLMTLEEMKDHYEVLESWGQFVYDHLRT